MKKIFLLFISGILLLSAVPSSAAGPQETVRTDVNEVLAVLRDASLPKAAKTQKLEAIYEKMFDEVELARRTLGANWKKLNESQQKEFIGLFRQVLEKAYIDKILAYTNEKIEFSKENMLSKDQAEVPTRVIAAKGDVPIAYRLIRKDDTWKVYDVVVENVSLVQNYRSQFNSILAKNTPDQLLGILRQKVKSQQA